jgi:hypothetical protein
MSTADQHQWQASAKFDHKSYRNQYDDDQVRMIGVGPMACFRASAAAPLLMCVGAELITIAAQNRSHPKGLVVRGL